MKFPPDLEKAIERYMKTGFYQSPEDALRAAIYRLDHSELDVAALIESFKDEAAGRVVPADEVIKGLQKRLQA